MKFSKQFWERAVWVWILCFPLAFAGSFSTSVGTAQINNVLASPGPIGSVTPNTGSFSTLASPSVAITGGTITGITGTSSFGGGAIGLGAAGGINGVSVSAPTFSATGASGKYQLNSSLLFSATAPTILAGFGTSPSVVQANGTSTFAVQVGTGGTASSGSLTFPAAATSWHCYVENTACTAVGTCNAYTDTSPSTTTVISVNNRLLTSGANTAWPASTILIFNCAPY